MLDGNSLGGTKLKPATSSVHPCQLERELQAQKRKEAASGEKDVVAVAHFFFTSVLIPFFFSPLFSAGITVYLAVLTAVLC